MKSREMGDLLLISALRMGVRCVMKSRQKRGLEMAVSVEFAKDMSAFLTACAITLSPAEWAELQEMIFSTISSRPTPIVIC